MLTIAAITQPDINSSMAHPKAQCGFTLVEVSIVLVIIGLIVGGITIGTTLIRQSQISSAITDVQRYVQATQNFQAKYGTLPGDFGGTTTTTGGAAALWGAGSTCPSTYAHPLTPPATCNGDGNGQIGISGASTAAPQEIFYFWEHLYNGQFIQGTYTGTPGSGGTKDVSLGSNTPASRVRGAGFEPLWIGIPSTTPYFSSGVPFFASTTSANLGHVFLLGGYVSNALLTGNILKSAEAFSIDSKFDDGNPGTGNIQSWANSNAMGYSTSCATSSTAYNTSLSDLECSMIFVTGF